MSKFVTDLIFPGEDLGAAGTETIPIRTKKPISRIEMTYKTTFGSSEQAAPGPACITKIELVDGAKALHSLTGYTNQALAYYNRPGVAMEHGQHINTLSQVDLYAIDFGRYLWDRQFAFDPTRFNNPQLKVTFDEDASEASASAGTLEVWAEEFDEDPPSPSGFLRAEALWTGNFLADNSINEVLLPDDEVIRQILVRAHYDGYEPWYQIDIAKLDQQGDGKEIFNFTDLEMYYRRMKSRWPMLHVPLYVGVTTSARTFYVPATDYWANCSLMGVNQMSCTYEDGASGRGGKFGLIGENDQQVIGESRGYLPWHTFQFPMGVMDDPDSWYNPKDKAPRLRLTSNSAGTSGDGDVVIETIHAY